MVGISAVVEELKLGALCLSHNHSPHSPTPLLKLRLRCNFVTLYLNLGDLSDIVLNALQGNTWYLDNDAALTDRFIKRAHAFNQSLHGNVLFFQNNLSLLHTEIASDFRINR